MVPSHQSEEDLFKKLLNNPTKHQGLFEEQTAVIMHFLETDGYILHSLTSNSGILINRSVYPPRFHNGRSVYCQ